MIIVRQTESGWQPITGILEVDGIKLDMYKVAKLVASGVWSEEDLAKFGFKAVEPFAVPSDKQPAGSPIYEEVNGKIIETIPLEDTPVPAHKLYKSTFIGRLTEEEAVVLEAVLANASAKHRLMYQSVEYFMSDDPLFGVMYSAVTKALGEKRADELLGEG